MKAALLIAIAAAALAGSALVPRSAALAQSGGVVKDVFGKEPCPASNGEEIVVCRRFPADEKWRIPKDLRDSAKDAPPATWTDRAKQLEYVGRSGTNSCSPDGGGGWTGCWARLMHDAKAEQKDAKKAEPVLP
jgi:hypothetical protein